LYLSYWVFDRVAGTLPEPGLVVVSDGKIQSVGERDFICVLRGRPEDGPDVATHAHGAEAGVVHRNVRPKGNSLVKED
jgi:hypothetical protein